MKRFIAVFLLLSIVLSFASCKKDDPIDPDPGTQSVPISFDIVKTRDIVLGNEVDTVELTTRTGEKFTFDNTADFYDIFNKVGFNFVEEGKLYSCSGETQLGDKSKSYTNMNMYYIDDPALEHATIDEFRTKKEGDDNVALVEEYTYGYRTEGGYLKTEGFSRYEYKDEKAFCGGVTHEDGYKVYKSDKYPMIPESGSEFADMQSRAYYLKNLLIYTAFFTKYEAHEAENGTVYDFDQFITREYKLYENYIVFKYTAPFIALNLGFGQDTDLAYRQLTNADWSVTQEAYCNVKTGEIEFVKVYGETGWTTGEYWNIKAVFDIKIYVHDIDKDEVKNKTDALINYVKSNTTVVD